MPNKDEIEGAKPESKEELKKAELENVQGGMGVTVEKTEKHDLKGSRREQGGGHLNERG